jgi:hypothetical protein
MPNLTFWEKWNSIAQSKGFADLGTMLRAFQENYTNKEIASLLDVSSRTVEMMWVKLGGKRRSQRDGDGFNKTDIKEKWIKLLSEKGFQNLREAGTYYKENKISLNKMAEDLGVTVKSLEKRLEMAGILLLKEEDKVKNLNPLGLL